MVVLASTEYGVGSGIHFWEVEIISETGVVNSTTVYGVGGSDILLCVTLPFAIEGDGPTLYICHSPRCGVGSLPSTMLKLPALELMPSGMPSPVRLSDLAEADASLCGDLKVLG